MKQWRCTVCDQIEKGDAPPDNCPVCGSENSLFLASGEEKKEAASPPETTPDEALRWQCVVCGYIHTGPEPPDKCPVCGADRSQFVCLDRETEDAAPADTDAASSAPDRKWRCTVCGYIHTGPEPPLECPVCGADRSLFEEVEAADATRPASGSATKTSPGAAKADDRAVPSSAAGKLSAFLERHRRLIDLAIENHAHPISVHIPNGVLPIAVVMVLLAALFDAPALGRAGFYNMVFILLSMPVVLFTGYLHWQYKFGGHMTALFKSKIISGTVVSLIALLLVIWALLDPQVVENPSLLYVGLHLIMLAAAGYAGYLGGRLVFHRAI